MCNKLEYDVVMLIEREKEKAGERGGNGGGKGSSTCPTELVY